MRLASPLKATVGEGPHPLLVGMISGVKVPCSTWRILCLYALFFSLLCLRYVELMDDKMLEGAKELKTLTSKSVLLWLLSQNFWALMSSLARSSVLMIWRENIFLVGLESWLKSNIRAHLCKEICCDVSNAIVSDRWQCSFGAAESMIHGEQLSTWTVRWKLGLLSIQIWGIAHPWMPVYGGWSCTLLGGVQVSQEEAPFSLACSIARWWALDSLGFSAIA